MWLRTFRSMWWQKTLIIVLALNMIYSNQSKREGNKNTSKKWFNQVKLPSFTSPYAQNNEKFHSMQNDTTPLVQVIDCDEPNAIYQYDYKVILITYFN